MLRWQGWIKFALSAIALLAPWFFLPTAWVLLVDILLVVVLVMLDANRNRFIFTLAKRYSWRRPATTALVIGGLMVGTAIISASFVVSDTLDNLIVSQVTEGLGDVDFALGSRFSTNYVYLDDTDLSNVSEELIGSQLFDITSQVNIENSVIINPRTGLSSLSNIVIGLGDDTVVGFGGFVDLDGGHIVQAPSATGILVPENAALELDATQGDTLVLVRGNHSLPLVLEGIVGTEGLGGYQLSSGQFQSSPSVFVNRTTMQAWTGNLAQSNLLLVKSSERGSADLYLARAEVVRIIGSYQSISLEMIQDKQEAMDDGRDASSAFTSLFFVFGSFSVIAGVALVLNIFTMLGEERKSEMGIARAIGMQRFTMRRLFTYEGVIYGALAAGVGALVGILMAFIIIFSISGIFDFSGLAIDRYFTFTLTGLAYAYLLGFLITMATVYVATSRISNLNIVRAIRNVPEPPIPQKDRHAFVLGLSILLAGIPLVVMGVSWENLGLSMSGISLGTLSLGLLIRRFIGDRLAWNLAGLSTLSVWLALAAGFRIFPYDAEIEMLVVAGLFMLVSLLLLVMFNSDAIIKFFTSIIRARSSYRAVVRTAISYPLKAKVRTGLSIFIFGLVIFTVTILTMISGVLNYNIPIMVEETSGGFDAIGFTLDPRTVFDQDPWQRINSTAGPLSPGNVSNLLSISTVGVRVNGTRMDSQGQLENFEFDTLGLGVSSRFYTEGYYPLDDWDRSLFGNEQEVWEGVLSNGSLAIIDGGLSGGANQFSPVQGNPGLLLGDSFTVIAYDGTRTNITVVGVMKQSALGGLFVNEVTVDQGFKALGQNRILITYSPGLDAKEQSVLLEKEFLDVGLSTISVKALAQEITKSVDSIFTLFRAFLAMGLIIGIAGLGIITIRSINERRLEIGMMRAIGFTKRMVVVNFALESAFISLLGIVAGSLLGIVVGYQLWAEALRSEDFVFIIDWQSILIVGVLAFLATMLSVLPAARSASKVSPAEVLRFE